MPHNLKKTMLTYSKFVGERCQVANGTGNVTNIRDGSQREEHLHLKLEWFRETENSPTFFAVSGS